MHADHPFTCTRLLLAGCLVIAAQLPGAAGQRVSMRDGEHPLERCDQLEISFDNRPALRGEQTVHLPAGDRPLEVNVADHGGIALRETTGGQHEITLCKAVPAGAGGDLDTVRPAVNGKSVAVIGPPGRRWVGYLLVKSPRGSLVSLSTTNGPVRAESFEGQLTARTTNGPIALARVRGTVHAHAENGPVSLEGDGGHVSIDTLNGPIAVRLVGTEWNGGDLVARAQNGPLSVDVPDQYRSTVEIESSGHVPWSCGGGCGAEDDRSGARRMRLGNGPTHVKLSTVNGPVSVR